MVQVSLPIKAISLILGDRIIAVGDTETDADMVIISGKPPALPGRFSEFDICWSKYKTSYSVSRLRLNWKRGFMRNSNSLNHSKWECMFHLTWIPKYRKKKIYGHIRQYLGDILRDLARQKECKVLEGHLMPDHVHMLISIPPKYAVAQVVGFIKG